MSVFISAGVEAEGKFPQGHLKCHPLIPCSHSFTISCLCLVYVTYVLFMRVQVRHVFGLEVPYILLITLWLLTPVDFL